MVEVNEVVEALRGQTFRTEEAFTGDYAPETAYEWIIWTISDPKATISEYGESTLDGIDNVDEVVDDILAFVYDAVRQHSIDSELLGLEAEFDI